MTRKEFLARLGLGAGAVLLVPAVLNSCEESDDSPSDDNGSDKVDFTIDLSDSDYSDLGNEGGYVYKNNIIIAYLGNDEYIALSKICTHQQCTVDYNHSQGQMECPCHGSVYSTSGAVIDGPAPDPLKEYNTELSGQTLRIFEG